MAIEIREVEPNFVKGSKEERFEKLREELCGKATYTQEFDTEKEEAGHDVRKQAGLSAGGKNGITHRLRNFRSRL